MIGGAAVGGRGRPETHLSRSLKHVRVLGERLARQLHARYQAGHGDGGCA